MENIKRLEKNFIELMESKNFKDFCRTNPRLLNVIMKSMNEVSNKNKEKIDLTEKTIEVIFNHLDFYEEKGMINYSVVEELKELISNLNPE